MEVIKNYRLILLLLLPFLLGWLFNSTSFFLNIYIKFTWPINIVFLLYWFWVGKQFGQLRYNKFLVFLLGNVLWALSFGLFIWQFVFVDDPNRNLLIAAFSQLYPLLNVVLSSRIIMLFDNSLHGTQIVSISYIIMLFVFLSGFLYGSIRLSRTMSNGENKFVKDSSTI